MNSVGIDISKGRSTIAVMRPFGEVVISPFEVRHTDSELSKLARRLKSLNGETRVVMEATGNYHAPVAKLLRDAGLLCFRRQCEAGAWLREQRSEAGQDRPKGCRKAGKLRP